MFGALYQRVPTHVDQVGGSSCYSHLIDPQQLAVFLLTMSSSDSTPRALSGHDGWSTMIHDDPIISW